MVTRSTRADAITALAFRPGFSLTLVTWIRSHRTGGDGNHQSVPPARRSRLGDTTEPREDGIKRVHLFRESEQVELAQTVGDQSRVGGATRDASQLAHECEHVPAVPHVKPAGGETMRRADIGRGGGKTPGQRSLEGPLGA